MNNTLSPRLSPFVFALLTLTQCARTESLPQPQPDDSKPAPPAAVKPALGADDTAEPAVKVPVDGLAAFGDPHALVTVVAFTDYECPYCRSTHLELSKAILGGPPVRIVRHHVPLPSHPHADLAARAAICAESLGARMDRMDDALFTAGSSGLHAAACEDAAADAGVADRDAFKACLHSASTDERLRRDLAVYAEAGSGGVPLTYVGKRRFEGAQDAPTFREAIAEAARK